MKGRTTLKKGIGIVLSILILWAMTISQSAQAIETPVEIAKHYHESIDKKYNPKSAYVTTQQGQILYDYNGQRQLDPASTAKLMTVYLILEDVQNQKIHLTDKVKITSEYEEMAQLPNLTTFPVKKNQVYTIDQLLKQVMLESSNAASLILADHIDGNIEHFTNRMNEKAKAMGMHQTHYTNPSGANNKLLKQFAPKKYKHETASKSSAQDIAVLAQQLIKEHPKVLDYSKLETDEQYHKKLKNTNLSLPHAKDGLSSAEGLKTGTSENGYNLVLTAKQNNLRINTVILNVLPYPSEHAKHARQKLANDLTKDAMKHYEYRKVLSKGTHEIDGKQYDVEQDLYDVVPKDKDSYHLSVKDDKVQADYPRQFLKGAHPPSVTVEPVSHTGLILTWIFTIIGGIVLGCLILYILFKRLK